MPAHDLTPWNVYSRQLLIHGYGYPLWNPQPNKKPDSKLHDLPVQIGDVGYIRDGTFIRLFNAMEDAHAEINMVRGVPQTRYTPFTIGERATISEELGVLVPGTVLCSKTVRSIGEDLTAQIVQNGLSITLECASEQGAVLHVKDGAHRQQLDSRRMRNYMKDNLQDWFDFATSDEVDVPVEPEDIVFVYGFIKTTYWAVAAYADGGMSARFTLNGGYGPASAGISAFTKVGRSRAPVSRWGPVNRLEHTAQHSTEADQCIFLRYYKMRRRLGVWPTVIKAGAGDDEQRRDIDDPTGRAPMHSGLTPTSNDSDDVEQCPGHQTMDPANDVLDYILRASEATFAIASDDDIVRLCKMSDCELPEDIPAFLDKVSLPIDVNEDGLGMLSFEGDATTTVLPDADHQQDVKSTKPAYLDEPSKGHFESDAAGSTMHDIEESTPRARVHGASTVLASHSNRISAISFSPDGALLATGDDVTIKVWRVRDGQLLRVFGNRGQPISTLALAPDNVHLVSGSSDGLAIIHSIDTGERHTWIDPAIQGKPMSPAANGVSLMAYSPDGTVVAMALFNGTVSLRNAKNWESISVFRGHNADVTAIAFSPDGHLLASASADSSVYLWPTVSGAKDAYKLQGHMCAVNSLAFSPDSRYLASAAEDGTVRIWKAHTGEELVILREHACAVWATVFSADGRRVISGGSDGTVTVCNTLGGELLQSMECGGATDDGVGAIALSADGARACASTPDNSIHVKSTKAGRTLAVLAGHEDKIGYLAFSPDGNCIASASDDGTLRIWELAHDDGE